MKGEALAKPPVYASGGFRVRGSGGVFGLNPGILNPDSRHPKGFARTKQFGKSSQTEYTVISSVIFDTTWEDS